MVYILKLPPVAASREELFDRLHRQRATPMETDTSSSSTSTEQEPSTQSEMCVTSPMEPEERQLGEVPSGCLTLLSPSKVVLLSLLDEGSPSCTIVAASLPPHDSSSAIEGISGFLMLAEYQLGKLGTPSPTVISSEI